MWTDSHCHLDFPTFNPSPDNTRNLVQRALDAGVMKMVNVGCDLESSMKSWELALEYDCIYAVFGVHPNEADLWDESVAQAFREKIVEDRARMGEGERKRIVGIGEVGLDYFRKGASREVQQRVFREQIEFAKEMDLPVIVHCRDAFEDTLSILESLKVERVIFHCFTGNLEIAKRVWSHGWITSFAAVVTYPKNEELREVVRQCPDGLFLLETDAPFLPHQSIRGQQNEPEYLPKLAEFFSDLLGVNPQGLSLRLEENLQEALF